MKRNYLLLALTFLFVLNFSVLAQEKTGQLIDTIIPAPSLKGSLINTPTEQPIVVYLPPSYNDSDQKFPVVYFLPGFGSYIRYLTIYRVFQGFHLGEAMDRLINEGKINEMIVVIPNGVNLFSGHFYVNSSVTGNWEDFLINDLVSFVDKSFRTFPESDSRGIGGHSMGGFAALNLAMLHPDIFSVSYALAPGLFDENGLEKHIPLTGEDIPKSFLAKQEELNKTDEKSALFELCTYLHEQTIIHNNFRIAFCYAYGAAFSPNPNGKPPYINYLYRTDGDKLVRNESNYKNYENGFGNLKNKIEKYENNLKKLNTIHIDFGINDNYEWIPEGCKYYSKLLTEKNIKHSLVEFDGGHSTNFKQRLEDVMFPLFSEKLNFE